MKKIYMTPVAKEIKLKYQFSLLANSVTLDGDDNSTDIIDAGDIIDNDGSLDPDSREFDFDEEDF
jgi:hypothetical protein